VAADPRKANWILSFSPVCLNLALKRGGRPTVREHECWECPTPDAIVERKFESLDLAGLRPAWRFRRVKLNRAFGPPGFADEQGPPWDSRQNSNRGWISMAFRCGHNWGPSRAFGGQRAARACPFARARSRTGTFRPGPGAEDVCRRSPRRSPRKGGLCPLSCCGTSFDLTQAGPSFRSALNPRRLAQPGSSSPQYVVTKQRWLGCPLYGAPSSEAQQRRTTRQGVDP